jgi:hypothetical protein
MVERNTKARNCMFWMAHALGRQWPYLRLGRERTVIVRALEALSICPPQP